MLIKDLRLYPSLNIPLGRKSLVNTVNAWSFVVAQHDAVFRESLEQCDYLLPDGQSIVWACRPLGNAAPPPCRITGWDLFVDLMTRLDAQGREEGTMKRVFFLGSSEACLDEIGLRAIVQWPNLTVKTLSPPFRNSFSVEESSEMIRTVNGFKPDLLWVGMTAPKQEKWVYEHYSELDVAGPMGSIGAVFSFYSGHKRRAPKTFQQLGLEWLFRFLLEPRRTARRYLYGNAAFLWLCILEFLNKRK